MNLIEKFKLAERTSVPVATAKECCQIFWEWMNGPSGHPEHYPDEEVIRFAMQLKAEYRNLGRPARVLDLGSGSGKNSGVLAECGFDLFCADWARSGLAYGEERLRAHNLKAEFVHVNYAESPLPFASDFFEGVVAIQTYDHLIDADARALLKETHRVLAPGGQLLCSLMTTRTSKPSRMGIPLEGESCTQLVSVGNSAGEIHRFFDPKSFESFFGGMFTIKGHVVITAQDLVKNEIAEASYFRLQKPRN